MGNIHIDMVVKVIEKTEVARRICKARKENKMQLSLEILGDSFQDPIQMLKLIIQNHVVFAYNLHISSHILKLTSRLLINIMPNTM